MGTSRGSRAPGEGVFVVDLHGLGLAGGELVIGEREPGRSGLQAGEDQDQGVLQGVGARGVGSGQLGEPLGLREVVAMVLTLGGVTLALQRA